MKTITNLIISVSMVLICSCGDKYPGEPLVIRNNTDKDIYFWYASWKMDNFYNYHYPDTILPVEKPILINYISFHNSARSGEADPNWEQIFSELKHGVFSVYFFKELPENQSDWDLIRQNYNLTRVDVTYKEFVDNNYIIDYP